MMDVVVGHDRHSYSRQQLISHTVNGQITSYVYNSEGIRTQQTSLSQSTVYLIDQNRDYAQVLAEYDSTGLKIRYSYGDDLISQTQAQRLTTIIVWLLF